MMLAQYETFFMWNFIFGCALIMLWALLLYFCPKMVYATQQKWLPVSQEKFQVIIYCMLGAFKLAVLLFFGIPFLTLTIMY